MRPAIDFDLKSPFAFFYTLEVPGAVEGPLKRGPAFRTSTMSGLSILPRGHLRPLPGSATSPQAMRTFLSKGPTREPQPLRPSAPDPIPQ